MEVLGQFGSRGLTSRQQDTEVGRECEEPIERGTEANDDASGSLGKPRDHLANVVKRQGRTTAPADGRKGCEWTGASYVWTCQGKQQAARNEPGSQAKTRTPAAKHCWPEEDANAIELRRNPIEK